MQTRYANIARELAEGIATGRYPVGSLMPPELELADEFAVSRSTIRAAMRELQATGLISRRKSIGTRVEAAGPPREQPGFFQAIGSVEEVQQFGAATIRRPVASTEIVADDDLGQRLGVRPGSKWLRISSLRLWRDRADDPPVCWTDVYVGADFSAGVLGRLDQTSGLISDLIEEISGRRILEIRQDIRAIAVSETLAEALKADGGSPGLEVRRQYLLSPSTLAEISISVYPGPRFTYSTRLTRNMTEQ